MARNGRCKGGQGKTELENGGKRRGEWRKKREKIRKKCAERKIRKGQVGAKVDGEIKDEDAAGGVRVNSVLVSFKQKDRRCVTLL